MVLPARPRPVTQPPLTAPPAVIRMRLDSLIRGKQTRPLRVVLFGTEGIGKSTFGSQAPNPIFLGAEEGTDHLDVVRFPQPETFQDVRDAIRTLIHDPHEFQTLVVDTLDWLEPLIWSHICQRDGKVNVEDYGYGKGYVAALDEWRVLAADLERLRNARGMHVVLLAHCWIKPFKNPTGDDFDRYEMKIHAKAAGLLKEWADVVLFANYETLAYKDERTKRVKGISTGSRLIFTNRTAAYDAKNRFSLPNQLPLDWNEFWTAVREGKPADPVEIEAAIRTNLQVLAEADQAQALAAIDRAAGDPTKLSQLLNWVNGKAVVAGAGGEA